MVTVRQTIHINAPVEGVFRLISDPSAKSELNPLVCPIRIELEDGRPLHQGSHCHYRLQSSNSIVDYFADIVRFEKNHLIESRVETDPPVRVVEELAPEAGGTRLTQTESFEVDDAILDSFSPPGLRSRVLGLAYMLAIWFDADVAKMYRAKRERLLQDKLSADLGRWLSNIKRFSELDQGIGAR
ncbi:MAG: SRPBCC family protein [Sedimenticola sp.]